MQVKVTPLNFNPVTNEFEASSNVSYPQLAEGRLRIRIAFLPMNEQQHEMVAEILPKSQATIVNGSADPLLRITREDEAARLAPGQAPKVHAIGSPLFVDIEIGPRAPSADAEIAAEAPQLAAKSGSARLELPAATIAPATPTGATSAPPARNSEGGVSPNLQDLDDEIS